MKIKTNFNQIVSLFMLYINIKAFEQSYEKNFEEINSK